MQLLTLSTAVFPNGSSVSLHRVEGLDLVLVGLFRDRDASLTDFRVSRTGLAETCSILPDCSPVFVRGSFFDRMRELDPFDTGAITTHLLHKGDLQATPLSYDNLLWFHSRNKVVFSAFLGAGTLEVTQVWPQGGPRTTKAFDIDGSQRDLLQ